MARPSTGLNLLQGGMIVKKIPMVFLILFIAFFLSLVGIIWFGIIGGIAVFFLTLTYFLYHFFRCEKILLRAHGAVNLDSFSVSTGGVWGLKNIASRLAFQLNLPQPEVHLVRDSVPYIFSVGRDRFQYSLVISTALVGMLNEEELADE